MILQRVCIAEAKFLFRSVNLARLGLNLVAKENRHNSILTETIIQLIKNRKPNDVQELVNRVKEKTAISESKIIEHIIRLQSQGKITLKSVQTPPTKKLSIYLKTKEASWYWITLILAATTTITTFTIPENAYPIIYIRYVLGTLFAIWLPGYSLMKALFPTEPPFRTSSKSLDSIERLALSVGMSLALVPIIGLLLNYTPWGIRLTPVVLSLLTLTAVFATAGIIRERQSSRRAHNKVQLKGFQ